jgi:protein-S-isoprenylcysteine O-methyltransferase Ste14
LFSTVTCVQVWLIYAFWQADDRIVWQFEGPLALAIQACFAGSWLLLGYSMWLTGFGHQTGFTTWWAWVRKRKVAPREFQPRGLYLWLRHPIYFSFLGILWFTPVATADRLLLNLIWTGYIAVGSVLKDRRLLHYCGEKYRRYMECVPGYPLMPFGPLGKVAPPENAAPALRDA